jgi:hypothetical protein
MKIGTILCAIAALALCAGMVSADPFHVEEKPWSYPDGMYDGRDEYAEVEPNDTCPGTQTIACGDVITPALLDPAYDLDYYPFTLATEATVTLGTDVVTPGDLTDTYIELWSGDCLTQLGYNDDGGPGLYSLLIIDLPAGDYSVKVRAYGTGVGPYKLFIDCAGVEPPPENDTCLGAEEYGYFIERCTTGNLTGTTAAYTNDYNPGVPGPSCTGYSANGRDAVYYMDLEAGDPVSMTYTQLTTDTSFYIVTDCADMTSCVVGADDTGTGQPEVINWVCGTTGRYYLILDAWSTDSGGNWTLSYDVGYCPEPTPTNNTTWGQIKSTY